MFLLLLLLVILLLRLRLRIRLLMRLRLRLHLALLRRQASAWGGRLHRIAIPSVIACVVKVILAQLQAVALVPVVLIRAKCLLRFKRAHGAEIATSEVQGGEQLSRLPYKGRPPHQESYASATCHIRTLHACHLPH